MSFGRLSIRQLVCAGPGKVSATLDFVDGANALIGLSNTGKSFVLELIDFMFGKEALERQTQIPELDGYDTALLTLARLDGSIFTLRRSLSGGEINVLDGTITERTGGTVHEIIVRNDRKSGQPRSFSQFFLAQLGIAGKILRKTQTETQNLTLRPLIRLSLVDEQRIISTQSPALSSAQVISATSEKSLLKFLLTGTDDSALVLYSEQNRAAQQKHDQANAAQRLLAQRRKQLEEQGLEEVTLRNELASLEVTISNSHESTENTDSTVSLLRRRLRRLTELKDLTRTRISELDALLERFRLLDAHYVSDLARLTAIAEAARNLDSIAPGPCPLCGAPADAHQSIAGCSADLTALAQAAAAEAHRIHRLRADLQATVTKATAERLELLQKIEEANEQAAAAHADLAPALEASRTQRASYSQIMQQWAVLKEHLRAFDAVRDFEDSASVLKREADDSVPELPDVAISRASTDAFAQEVAAILSAWNVPETSRVSFDHQANDLQLNSRLRGGQGKGLRALTHAAFSIALMTYCLKNNKPHPGFVVIDSPLLSYRGEDEDADPSQSLKTTTVDQAFYRWLATGLSHGQVIVIENRDPPQDVREQIHIHEFLGPASPARRGFIPG